MVYKNFSYLFLLLFLLLQGIIILVLFNKSIQIDGDIVSYLKIMLGDINSEFDVEPLSLLIFRTIGFFPISFHFHILYSFIYILCIIESWIIFMKTKGSLLWIFFFTLAVLPFFHAINIRTGFGMFFLILSFKYAWSVIFIPFFHASFIPLLIGIKFKISVQTIFALALLFLLSGFVLYALISVKLETYFGYYNEDGSSIGVLAEIFLLGIFAFFVKKKYSFEAKILWFRILFVVLLIAGISFQIAIISSRFVTLAYLVILLIRLNSVEIKKKNNLTINNIFFFIFFFVLVSFRIYRVITMFGFNT